MIVMDLEIHKTTSSEDTRIEKISSMVKVHTKHEALWRNVSRHTKGIFA